MPYRAQMDAIADRLAIRDIVETWASARDSGDWEAFRACWHDDGYMMATWFQGPKEDFIKVSREGAARGVNILHFTGGCRPRGAAPVRARRGLAGRRAAPALIQASGLPS